MTGTFSIVGAGRLGASLAAALVRRGWRIALIVDKDPRAAREARRIVGAGRASASLSRESKPGEVVIIAVPDDAIAAAAAALARSGAGWTGRTVLHTSGLLPARVLDPLRKKGARAASLHPAQAFPRKDTPAEAFKGISWGVEGDAEALRAAERIVRALGGDILFVSERMKPLYHAACVLASNALVGLEATAAGLLNQAGIDEGTALRVLLPLVQGTLQNVKNLGLEKALTGPITRGDTATVRKHLAALRAAPGALEVYKVLGRRLLDVAGKGGSPEKKVRTLRRLLGGK
ncbi:MAG TPA: Rossmann-like and DUF2520 domain-containing protein [Acidobacteriota bacterium]|nr:Rossmann-like and DUF2520 domain-containing protein [Acidobacteriota bacterium]